MSNQGLRLSIEQISYIMDQTEIEDPMKAIEFFAEIMRKEGIRPTNMGEVINLLMGKNRKRIK